MEPKISIIIPSFNQGKYLEKTILSLINQNYSNLELIIVDGKSTDNSIEIINKYKAHFKHIIIEPDKGQSDALNKGIALATGEIINWLNSDDYLEKNALIAVSNAFKDPSRDIVAGYSVLHINNNTYLRQTTSINKGFNHLIAQGHIMQPSTFFRRSVFQELGLINLDLHFMMDHYHILKYWTKYETKKIKYIDDILTHVEFHSEAKSNKLHALFIEDRDYIFWSLFYHHKLKYIPLTNSTKSIPLPFLNTSPNILKNYKTINYLILINSIFKRNQYGHRVGINIFVLKNIVIHFPLHLFKNIFQFIKNK